MKDFSVTKDYSVTLFNSTTPLPKNTVYGVVSVGKLRVQYTYIPATGHLSLYMGGYDKRPNDKITSAAVPAIKAVLAAHKKEWEGLPLPTTYKEYRTQCDTRMNVRDNHAPVVGGPREKRPNTEILFNCHIPSGTWSDKVSDKIPGYWTAKEAAVKTPGSYFECGAGTAGPEAFLPKRNGMYAHDVQKCREQKPEPVVVASRYKSSPATTPTMAEQVAYTRRVEAEQAARLAKAGIVGRGH